ncbi:lysozyme [Enterococcus sp. BWM-S5]|uniref:Lysozyme n=1 Tax=Enterococcus larvae TaxID=2794352 RepID=A0ABS4CJF7_9ENTE|nr:lysozyme [Enterococcus larvae]MBP1046758.1 lysozyme [Enterococcus larvae]
MANENLKISQEGRNLIKKWEGLRLTAYQDSVGVWTIGYGHTSGVYAGMQITESQANVFLDEDIKSHASGIFKYVSVQLAQGQFDALVSFHFNLGAEILRGSQLLIYLNNREWQNAASEMKKYVYAGGQILQGLVNRRNDEAALFLKQVPSTETVAGNLDTFDIKAREIKIGGWHATSNSASGPHSYIFLLNAATGAELHREKITRLVRNDIAQAYPTIPNSKNSGFYLSIPVTDKLLGKQIRIMSRYAKEAGGNGQVSDFDYKPVKATLGRMNSGSLNGIKVEGNSVQLGGWHISNYGDNDTFRYLFLLDASTGQEVKRQTFVSVSRPDVAQAYPGQPFAGKSGFDVRIDTTGLKGRKVKVLARYATDSKGNKIIDDLYFDKVITL